MYWFHYTVNSVPGFWVASGVRVLLDHRRWRVVSFCGSAVCVFFYAYVLD